MRNLFPSTLNAVGWKANLRRLRFRRGVGAYHFRVEAYSGHTNEAALGSLIVGGDARGPPCSVRLPGVRHGELRTGRAADRAPAPARSPYRAAVRPAASRKPIQDFVDRTVSPSGHDQTVPRKRCKLGGVVGMLRVEDLHPQVSRAQDLRQTFQIILIARASGVRVTDDDSVCAVFITLL